MDLMQLGALGELVGGVAVIASLIFVGLQIRQNTRSNRHISTQNLVGLHANANLMISTNGELAEILQRSIAGGPDPLRPEEQLRFNTFWLGAYSQFDYAYTRYREGDLDADVWKRIEYEISVFLGLPGVAAWWSQDKRRFSDAFVQFVDRAVAETRTPSVIPTIGGQPRSD